MKKVNLYLFNLHFFIIEFCCAYCLYENFHNDHKIIPISDEESLKKENIDINSSIKEYNDIFQKTTNLKENIEKEINQINILFEKTIKDLTASYMKKHEILTKEENDLKEKLENEVTKTKEKLEIFLTELNNIIKVNNRFNEGVKKLQKEHKNIIKTLSYISKMGKNQKKMKILFQTLMKSLKFSFQEEQKNINYEEYYFSGIPIPKNISFKDISSNSLSIFWDIDNLNIINVDIKKIKFKVEMRKENKKDKFIKVYDGENKSCNINNLEKNSYYEFRVCAYYNDLEGIWCEVQKIKTKNIYINIDSIILDQSQRKTEFLEKIYEWSGYQKMVLIYRGSRDGTKGTIFHDKCDDQGPTITLFKNEKGNIFGGFSPISWKSGDIAITNSNYFLFTLTNIYNTQPIKFSSKNSGPQAYHGKDYGPYFYDIRTYNDYLNDNSYSNFPQYYEDNLGKGYSIFTSDNNSQYFKMKEIEVFKLL